jgi:tRNA(Glu) U13 pseudouridine synthase TruD
MTTERLRRYGNKVIDGDLVIRHGTKIPEVVSSQDQDFQSLEITRVVLPLPGYDVLYPSSPIGLLYLDLLKQDNIVFEKASKTIPEEGTSKGSYRHIVAKVLDSHLHYGRLLDPEKCQDQNPTTSAACSVMMTTVVRDD